MAREKVIKVKYDITADVDGKQAQVVLGSINKSLERMTKDITDSLNGYSKAAKAQTDGMLKVIKVLEQEKVLTTAQIKRYEKQVELQEQKYKVAAKILKKEQDASVVYQKHISEVKKASEVAYQERVAEIKRASDIELQAVKENRSENSRTFKSQMFNTTELHDLKMNDLKLERIQKSKDAKAELIAAQLNADVRKKMVQERVNANKSLMASKKALASALAREAEVERKILEINQKASALEAIQNIDPLKKTKILSTELEVLRSQYSTSKKESDENAYQLRLSKAKTDEDKKQLAVNQQQAKLRTAMLKEQIASKAVSLNQATTAEQSKTLLGTIKHAAQIAPIYMGIAQATNVLESAMGSVIIAAVEFDSTMRVLSAVTGENLEITKDLTHGIMALGEAYGGSLADFAETAKSLSRAGINTDELVKATEVTAQLGLITGDTIDSASNAIISYSQVYQKAGNKIVYTTEEIGDKLAYMANASRLSTEDIGTLSNYALASSKSVGMTVDVVNSLAVAFSNAGNNASTIGTQIRRFTSTLTSSSTAVKEFYAATGTNRRDLTTDLLKSKSGNIEDIEASNDAFEQFVRNVQSLSENEYRDAIQGMNILDNQFFNQLRNNGDEVIGHLKKSFGGLAGELDKTAVIADGMGKRWEAMGNRIINANEGWVSFIGEGATSGSEWLLDQASYIKDVTLRLTEMALTEEETSKSILNARRSIKSNESVTSDFEDINKLVTINNGLQDKRISLLGRIRTLKNDDKEISQQMISDSRKLNIESEVYQKLLSDTKDLDLDKIEDQATFNKLQASANVDLTARLTYLKTQNDLIQEGNARLELQKSIEAKNTSEDIVKDLESQDTLTDDDRVKLELNKQIVEEQNIQIRNSLIKANLNKEEITALKINKELRKSATDDMYLTRSLQKDEVQGMETLARALKQSTDQRQLSLGIQAVQAGIDRNTLANTKYIASLIESENRLKSIGAEFDLNKLNVGSDYLGQVIEEKNWLEAVSTLSQAQFDVQIRKKEIKEQEVAIQKQLVQEQSLSTDESIKHKAELEEQLKTLGEEYAALGQISNNLTLQSGILSTNLKITNSLSSANSQMSTVIKNQLAPLKLVTEELKRQYKLKSSSMELNTIDFVDKSRTDALSAFGQSINDLYKNTVSSVGVEELNKEAREEILKINKYYDDEELKAKKELISKRKRLEEELTKDINVIGKTGGDARIAQYTKEYQERVKQAKLYYKDETELNKALSDAKIILDDKISKANTKTATKTSVTRAKELKTVEDLTRKQIELTNIEFQLANGYEDKVATLRDELELLIAKDKLFTTEKGQLDHLIEKRKVELQIEIELDKQEEDRIKKLEKERRLHDDIAKRMINLDSINNQIANGYDDTVAVLVKELELLREQDDIERNEVDSLDHIIAKRGKELAILKAQHDAQLKKEDAAATYLNLIGDFSYSEELENERLSVTLKKEGIVVTKEQIKEYKRQTEAAKALASATKGVLDSMVSSIFSGDDIVSSLSTTLDGFNKSVADSFSKSISDSISQSVKTGDDLNFGIFDDKGGLTDIGINGAMTLGNLFTESAFGDNKNAERGAEFGQIAGFAMGGTAGAIGGQIGGAILGSMLGGSKSYYSEVSASGTVEAVERTSGGIFSSSSTKVLSEESIQLQRVFDETIASYNFLLESLFDINEDISINAGKYSGNTLTERVIPQAVIDSWTQVAVTQQDLDLLDKEIAERTSLLNRDLYATSMGNGGQFDEEIARYNESIDALADKFNVTVVGGLKRWQNIFSFEIDTTAIDAERDRADEILNSWTASAEALEEDFYTYFSDMMTGLDNTMESVFAQLNKDDAVAIAEHNLERTNDALMATLENDMFDGVGEVTLQNFDDLKADLIDSGATAEEVAEFTRLGDILVQSAIDADTLAEALQAEADAKKAFNDASYTAREDFRYWSDSFESTDIEQALLDKERADRLYTDAMVSSGNDVGSIANDLIEVQQLLAGATTDAELESAQEIADLYIDRAETERNYADALSESEQAMNDLLSSFNEIPADFEKFNATIDMTDLEKVQYDIDASVADLGLLGVAYEDFGSILESVGKDVENGLVSEEDISKWSDLNSLLQSEYEIKRDIAEAEKERIDNNISSFSDIKTDYIDFSDTSDEAVKLQNEVDSLSKELGLSSVTFDNFGDMLNSIEDDVNNGSVTAEDLGRWSDLNSLLQEQYSLQDSIENDRLEALEAERVSILELSKSSSSMLDDLDYWNASLNTTDVEQALLDKEVAEREYAKAVQDSKDSLSYTVSGIDDIRKLLGSVNTDEELRVAEELADTYMTLINAENNYNDAMQESDTTIQTVITSLDELQSLMESYSDIKIDLFDFSETFNMTDLEKVQYQIDAISNSLSLSGVTFDNFGESLNSLEEDVAKGLVTDEELTKWSDLNSLLQEQYSLQDSIEKDRLEALEAERVLLEELKSSIASTTVDFDNYFKTFDMTDLEKNQFDIDSISEKLGVMGVTLDNYTDILQNSNDDNFEDYQNLGTLLEEKYALESQLIKDTEDARLEALEAERDAITKMGKDISASMESILTDEINRIQADYDDRVSIISSLESSGATYAPETTVSSFDIYSAIDNWTLDANDSIESSISAWNSQQLDLAQKLDDEARASYDAEIERLQDIENARVDSYNASIDAKNEEIRLSNELVDTISRLKVEVATTFSDLYSESSSQEEITLYNAIANKDYDSISSSFSSFATSTKDSDISDVDAFLKIAYANKAVQDLVQPVEQTELQHIEASTVEIAEYVSTLSDDEKLLNEQTVLMYDELIKQNESSLPNVEYEIAKLFEQNQQFFDPNSDFYSFLERGATDLTFVEKMDEQKILWDEYQLDAVNYNEKNLCALEKIDLSFNKYADATVDRIDSNESATQALEDKLDLLQKSYDEQIKLNKALLDAQLKANEIAEITADNTKEGVLYG